MTLKYAYDEVRDASIDYFNGDELAAEVFAGKYALRDLEGNIYEKTPSDMHNRLAREFARIEANYPNALSEGEIFSLFDSWSVVPQGSPMSALGNPYQLQSLSNCFVIESPYDSYAGILKADQEQAQIMKRRGGVGFDISTIRPKGIKTANAARTTDGIGIFMERFSNTCREVAQGGRRGALMLTIDVHHAEVRTFINIKRDKKKVTGANVSIRLSDEFMRAVKEDTTVDLRFPVKKDAEHIVKYSVSARELWNEIIDAAWSSAEPGVQFWDTIKRETPAEAYASVGFETVSSNPCVVGSTVVETTSGSKTVKELVENKAEFFVKSYNEKSQTPEFRRAVAFKTRENAKILEVKTKSGKSIKLTPDHKVLTQRGWIEARDLTLSDKLLSISKKSL